MKRWLLLLWLLVPLPVVVWHYGPGQRLLARDRAFSFIRRAEQAEAKKDWHSAEKFHKAAADLIRGGDSLLKTRLDVALARDRYHQGQALEAMNLMDQVIGDPLFQSRPLDFQREARELAGRIHYHASWVMRLEGARRELWMEEAELARQNFRMLSESSLAAGILPYSQLQQTNLETAIRLERMSLMELMARPLPEEGRTMAGQGLTEQMAGRRGRRGEGQGSGPGQDARDPANGAGTARFKPGIGS